MDLHFSNGTARQQQWVNDAIGGCSYQFDLLNVSVTVVFTAVTNCTLKHTYMCTTGLGGSTYVIQIEPWADDPKDPNNAGLPDPYLDLHEFFVDSVIHELGHVVQDELLRDVGAACATFTHVPDGRRGAAADYGGAEVDSKWPDLIEEAISEWFRLAFRPYPQVYWNRTNWNLSPADFATLMRMLVPMGWKYGSPQVLTATRTYDEAEGDTFIDDTGVIIDLGRRGWIVGNALGGVPILDAPDFSVGGGLPNVFATSRFRPTMFSKGSLVWGGLASPGIYTTDQTGEDVTPFRPDDFGTVRAYDPSVQPAYRGHFGYPGVDLGDPQSWSGWHVTRAVYFQLDYSHIHHAVKEQGWQGWGVVQVIESGAWVGDDHYGATWYRRDALGFHGPLPSGLLGGDPSPPWGADNTIIKSGEGVGPWPDWTPAAAPAQGWYAGVVQRRTVRYTIGGGSEYGQADWYIDTTHQTIVPPTTPTPPSPPAPPGYPTLTGSTTPTPTALAEQNAFDWAVVPIQSIGRSYSYPVHPDRIYDRIGYAWNGFGHEVDTYTNLEVSFIYWPVSFQEGKLPPYPARNQGAVTPGRKLGGTIRATEAVPMAVRRHQPARRVAGGRAVARATFDIGRSRKDLEQPRDNTLHSQLQRDWPVEYGGLENSLQVSGSGVEALAIPARGTTDAPVGQAIGWVLGTNSEHKRALKIPATVEAGDVLFLQIVEYDDAGVGQKPIYWHGWHPLYFASNQHFSHFIYYRVAEASDAGQIVLPDTSTRFVAGLRAYVCGGPDTLVRGTQATGGADDTYAYAPDYSAPRQVNFFAAHSYYDDFALYFNHNESSYPLIVGQTMPDGATLNPSLITQPANPRPGPGIMLASEDFMHAQLQFLRKLNVTAAGSIIDPDTGRGSQPSCALDPGAAPGGGDGSLAKLRSRKVSIYDANMEHDSCAVSLLAGTSTPDAWPPHAFTLVQSAAPGSLGDWTIPTGEATLAITSGLLTTADQHEVETYSVHGDGTAPFDYHGDKYLAAWNATGPVGDHHKIRVHFLQPPPVAGWNPMSLFAVVVNVVDRSTGLAFWLDNGGCGWTDRINFLGATECEITDTDPTPVFQQSRVARYVYYQDYWSKNQPGIPGLDYYPAAPVMSPTNAALAVAINNRSAVRTEPAEFWIEIWRNGTTFTAWIYVDDPDSPGVRPVYESKHTVSAFDAHYAPSIAGYFGFAAQFLLPTQGVKDIKLYVES